MHNIIILRETVCILTVDDHHTVQVENRFGFSLAGYFQLAHVRFGRGINGLKWRLIFPGERENIRQVKKKNNKKKNNIVFTRFVHRVYEAYKNVDRPREL